MKTLAGGDISIDLSGNSVRISLLALLVMNFDRYLATYYPVFHGTSVTNRRLLTVFGILVIIQAALGVMSQDNFIISRYVYAVIFLLIVAPPMFFINYKLLTIARKNCRNNGVSPEMKKSFPQKNESNCLLSVACFLALSIPGIIYTALGTASE